MALQVWLPLNGNLNNQGLSNITIVNNGNVDLTQNGKIGKCGTFNGSNYLSGTLDGFDASKDYTLALWFMMTTITTTNARIIQIGETTGRTNYADAQAGISIDYNNSGTAGKFAIMQGGKYPYISQSFSANTWYHVAVTKISGLVKVYLNGNLIGQSSSIGSGTTNSNVYIGNISLGTRGITGKINDVRIYDHCLSAKEVKEISQGLVLHYKMDGDGTVNLLKNSRGITTGWGTYAAVTSLTYENGRIKAVGDTTGSPRIYNSTILPYAATQEYYTIMIDYECSGSISVNGKSSNSTTTLNESGSQSIGTVTLLSSKIIDGNHKVNVYKWYQLAATDTIKAPWWMISFPTGTTLYVNSVKVEKGINNNPVWSPSSADSQTDYNVIYDDSGYGNNGTVTGTLTMSSASPRYDKCGTFQNTSSYIKLPVMNFTGMANSYTFSWWGKISSIAGKMAWGFSNGNRLNLYPTTYYCLNTGDGGSNPFGTASYSSDNNVWCHWAIVGNGTSDILYKNGVNVGTAKTYKSLTGTQIYISGWDTSTSYKWVGDLSDFRIYATALSAEDVLDLYHTSASIDKNGNLHCFQLKED